MVKRPATPIRSANAGEFSPDAKGRVDIKQYYSAGLAYKNVEPVPQSGYRQMGGSRRKGKARNLTTAVPITGVVTDLGPHAAGTWTIWQGNVADSVALVYVPGITISAGTLTFNVQALIGGVWVTIGAGAFTLSATAPARTAAFEPGGQRAATALRVQAVFSALATATIGTVAAYKETATPVVPRHVALTTDAGVVFSGWASADWVDFFTDVDGYCGAARVSEITTVNLPELGFYAEGYTIGIFQRLMTSKRLFLFDPFSKHQWQVDDWPYEKVPVADLGGVYAKTSDTWSIFLRWPTDGVYEIRMQLTVDGEETPAIVLTDAGGTPKTAGSGAEDWGKFASDIDAALEALPSLGAGVVVTESGGSLAHHMLIVFTGALAGIEYSLTANVVNTASVSALPSHDLIGSTALEALFSMGRGYPGFAVLVQDRLAYGRIQSARGAFALSRIGEYFDLNIEAQSSDAAILERLRSQTNETILAMKESKYLLIFTDRGVYFATNRTIDRNQPMNVVLASETASTANCQPLDLEGLIYYVARDEDDPQGGHQLLSLAYDDVSTSYNANPESLLASHLVQGIIRSVRQKKAGNLDASKGWLMRNDGRLIACQMIKNQDILGFCEWVAAGGGLVKEIGIDGRNKLWVAVQRGTDISIEIYDVDIFLQDALTVTPDLAGNVSGLPYADGAVLWAVANGYVLGPFTAAGGAIALGDAYASALVGRWQAPRYETMPQVYVTPGDDVIMRPGRIYSIDLNILATTSIAIGANGEAVRDIVLNEVGDPVDAAMPAKSKLISITGEDLPGVMVGPTVVVTQVRPGALRVRDMAIGAKL